MRVNKGLSDFHYVPEAITFRKFLYNEKNNKYCGRSVLSWAKIGLFYLVFYGALASLVGICLWVFMQTIDARIPKYKLERSIIGTNPGLGFRPSPPAQNIQSTLIWYKGTAEKDYKYWVDSLNEFLKDYEILGTSLGQGQNVQNCDYRHYPEHGQVCLVDYKSFGICNKENHFNYHKSGPCIFLKLNRIYGWIPEYYNDTNDLPIKMPKQLRDHIYNVSKIDRDMLNTVWVSCEGENPADLEYIGPINYYPIQGFPGYYFPYENADGYLSPLVAVNIHRPKSGVLINIECKAWAKNIIHSRSEQTGSVHFEILLD